MIKKSDSKGLSLATAPILGQAPSNATEEGRAENRRVEVLVLGRAYR